VGIEQTLIIMKIYVNMHEWLRRSARPFVAVNGGLYMHVNSEHATLMDRSTGGAGSSQPLSRPQPGILYSRCYCMENIFSNFTILVSSAPLFEAVS
jgi:hypothetical protein